MLIERQISVAFAGISAALLVPAYTPVLTGKTVATTGSPVVLLIATTLAALAVLMGLLVSIDELEGTAGGYRIWALAKTILWSIFALCVSAGTGMAAMHTPGTGWRTLLIIAAISPLAGATLVFFCCRAKS